MNNKMSLSALIIALLFQFTVATGQVPAFQWDARYGGSNQDDLFGLQQTNDGGYIIVGTSSSDLSGDKTYFNQGQNDYWAVKVNSSGVKEWDRGYGGSARDEQAAVIQTGSGNYLVAGTSFSNFSVDKSENSKGESDYWVLFLGPSGNKIWDKTIGGSGFEELACIRPTTEDGKYMLGGSTDSGISGDKTEDARGSADYWIVKMDGGFKEWDKRFGGSGLDQLTALQQTSDGGYILGGWSRSDSSGDKTQDSRGRFDYWVVKIDADGLKEWDRTFGGDMDDVLTSLELTNDGGYLLGGYSASGVSGEKTEAALGDNDYWIVKVNSSGVQEWDKTIGTNDNENLVSARQTADGGYILGGWSNAGISGDKTQPSQGSADYWVVKLNSSRVKEWDRRWGGSGQDKLASLQPATDGYYVLGGTSGSGMSGNKTQESQGLTDYWIVKLGASCEDSTDCADNNCCTIEACVEGECAHTPQDCSDEDACTVDQCVDGVCSNTPLNCNDNNCCTADACVDGCTHTELDCTDNDSDPCTVDFCREGACVSEPLDCDDHNLCTASDFCVEGICEHTPLDCTDENPCSVDNCVDGGCTHLFPCYDNNPCTDDTCDIEGACLNTPKDCSDQDGCTIDECKFGECTHEPITCVDFDLCTIDKCVDGACVFTQMICDDENLCTDDKCLGGVCSHTSDNPDCCLSASGCDDGEACNTDDCINNTCTHGPLQFELTLAVVHPLCNADCTGSIDLEVTGGDQSFLGFAWSNGSFEEDLGALCDGEYSVTVYDANQCSATASATISEPEEVLRTSEVASPSCMGACDGFAKAIASGGTPPYTYAWSTGDTTQRIDSLCADVFDPESGRYLGTYQCTATDANGCTTEFNFTLLDPKPLLIELLPTSPTCFDSCDGFIDLIASGVAQTLTVYWNNPGPQTTELDLDTYGYGEDELSYIFGPFCAGVYIFNVEDGNGCTASDTVEVNEPPSCDDGDPCTVDGCLEGQCNHSLLCDDGIFCTADKCFDNSGTYECINTPIEGCCQTSAGCDDLDACTKDDCTDNVCTHEPISCDDNNPCTTDKCIDGECAHISDNPDCCQSLADCDDGVCTIVACIDNICTYEVVTCDDGDGCTNDECDGGQCINTPIDCDDGNPCTIDDCKSGACVHLPVTFELNIKTEPLPAFCQGNTVTLTAVSPTAVSYLWSTGDAAFSITATVPGVYSVTATDVNGCETSASVTLSLQNFLSSYVIVADKQVHLHDKNTVFSGGVGATASAGIIKLQNGTMVTASGTFVIANSITLSGGSAATVQISSPAPVALPPFEFNPVCNGQNLNIPNNTTITVTGSNYKDVSIGSNCTITFTQTDLNMKSLKVKDNSVLRFADCTKLRICNKMDLGPNNRFNDGGKELIVYVEGGVTIGGGSWVTADIYSLNGNLHVKKATATNPNVMEGLFIAQRITGDDFTYWYRNTLCACQNQNQTAGRLSDESNEHDQIEFGPMETGEGEVMLKAYPNPFTDKLQIEFMLPQDAQVQMEVFTIAGEKITTLYEGKVKAGQLQKLEFNAIEIAGGLIIYRLQTEYGAYYGKAVMVR